MTVPLTDEQLRQMRERCDKATPGPWQYDGMHFEITAPNEDDRWVIISEGCDAPNDAPIDQFGHQESPDYAFIAAARQDIPDLLAEVGRLRLENAWLREYIGHDIGPDAVPGMHYEDGVLMTTRAFTVAREFNVFTVEEVAE